MSHVSFRANYIKPINIVKRENNAYVPYEAALVEFNPKDENDLNTIKNVSSSWEEENSFATCIYENAYSRMYSPINNSEHIYGIVKPQETYAKVQANNVLGLADFVETENLTELNYLQTHPANLSSKYPEYTPMRDIQTHLKTLFTNNTCSKPREYKNIGTVMLDFLKDIAEDRAICVFAYKPANGFYERNGFVYPDEICPSNMYWRRENIVTD